jgi:predicted DsbA family dithiol-disulfide isomerase
MPVIEVFADVRCPFTHVGLRRLVERRESEGADFALRVRAWPLELVNGEPLSGELIAEEVEALREQVAPDLFAGFPVRTFPASSLPGLALTAAAYDVDLETGERVALALRQAFFEEGLDVADPEVLDEIAGELGVPAADELVTEPVMADWSKGRDRGVIGSPHFFAGGQGWFCPALDISHEDGQLRIVDNGPALDAFLARALAG